MRKRNNLKKFNILDSVYYFYLASESITALPFLVFRGTQALKPFSNIWLVSFPLLATCGFIIHVVSPFFKSSSAKHVFLADNHYLNISHLKTQLENPKNPKRQLKTCKIAKANWKPEKSQKPTEKLEKFQKPTEKVVFECRVFLWWSYRMFLMYGDKHCTVATYV